MLKKVRIDKWLWSVRIFKSRTMATDACKSSKVRINDVSVKPSFLVEREALVKVNKGGFNLEFKVIDLIEKRVGAPIAITCYENLTPEEELNKYNDWFIGKGRPEMRERGSGRPTKKERRNIDGFKNDRY
ncbi:MAG: S4 domain-containing protein [Bacteroidetes bacterium]|jgi:ribosome-associated heat shock protein Hsp15|nr:S4 domain-containing protein [Bacteroidota bacterium]MDF1866319.1 S4 domain-containing protein [Saprospiraceae bacterium]